jgi:hypothetical protein
MSYSDIIEHFARLGFDVTIEELVFRSETVEDFMLARERLWYRGGNVERYEAQGIPSGERGTAQNCQPVRDIVVVSLFHARVVMGVLPTAIVDPRLRATQRQWVEVAVPSGGKYR